MLVLSLVIVQLLLFGQSVFNSTAQTTPRFAKSVRFAKNANLKIPPPWQIMLLPMPNTLIIQPFEMPKCHKIINALKKHISAKSAIL